MPINTISISFQIHFANEIDFIWRATISIAIETVERKYSKLLSKQNQILDEIWKGGSTEPGGLIQHKVSYKGEELFFDGGDYYALLSMFEAQYYLENIIGNAKKVSGQHSVGFLGSEKRVRNQFIKACCAVWAVDLGRKATFSNVTGVADDEAHGPLPDFIMMAAEGIVSSHNLDRRKLRGFLRTNREEIETAIAVREAELFG